MKERKAGQVVFGRYQLARPLARGGMSAVWVAVDRKLKREVALKLMAPTYAASERSRQRFELEAMSVARLQSPYIVQVFDYGVDLDAPFIVMELLSGEDLRTRIKREKRLAVGGMARILAQAAAGLSDAHDAGLVHRDMKPGNLFLTRTRGGELVKILDFGVAKAGEAVDEEEITERGSIVGTPQYMSPEQIRCLPEIDARSDLFSLGVIVYRGLTGALPFKGKTTSDLAVNICSSDFVAPSRLVPDLPPGIDDFMRVALAKSPADRFPSATAMAEAFSLLMPEGLELSLEGPSSLGPLSPRSSSRGPITGPGPVTTSGLIDPLGLSQSGTGPVEITMSSFSGGELSQTGAPTGPSFVSSPSGTLSSAGPLSSSGAPSGATFSSAPPATLGTSHSGTLASPALDGLGPPPARWKRKAAIGAAVVAVLGVAGVVGTVVGGSAADHDASATSPAGEAPGARGADTPAELAEGALAEGALAEGAPDGASPRDGGLAGDARADGAPAGGDEARGRAGVDATDPAASASAPGAAPAPKGVAKPVAGPQPPAPAPPKPKPADDWDPFDARK